ncbi:hypothetical protein CRT60_10000 [Azospirillum palustre]|uniref:Uncharacterized protein n=1 Tax=Azospirillum palustre TaxID=2044885 RepID=A0A2B8BDM2_9PROT|nr:hypothetical protein [Azospirillum palustre]PGH56846.1 hypothetical protein CRT60_10000 [Azospirillum palustre]
MSLKPQTIPPVPETTATVARAAFPKGTVVLRLRDELGTIYQDELFATYGVTPSDDHCGLSTHMARARTLRTAT